MIIGGNYTRREIYNDVYEYKCEDGYHFESYGTNYGKFVYGGEKLTNLYVIKKDEVDVNKKME